MDDLRVLWVRDRVYAAFGITDPRLFEELLNRNDGEVEDLILHFLNQTSDEEGALTLFFYRKVVPEEVEVEIGEPPRRGADLLRFGGCFPSGVPRHLLSPVAPGWMSLFLGEADFSPRGHSRTLERVLGSLPWPVTCFCAVSDSLPRSFPPFLAPRHRHHVMRMPTHPPLSILSLETHRCRSCSHQNGVGL
ncbi:hypothetical protein GH733_005144 [Mirounga leonina]|nr:hypothetical protein GH733_005144 [Mirounga leonina]